MEAGKVNGAEAPFAKMPSVSIENPHKLQVVHPEHGSWKVLMYIFIGYLFFLSAYTYGGLVSLPVNNSTSYLYPLSEEYESNIAVIKVSLDELTRRHREIKVQGRLLRYVDHMPTRTIYEMNSTVKFMKENRLVTSEKHKIPRTRIKFAENSGEIAWFPVFGSPIVKFDALKVTIRLKTDFKWVRGLELKYMWVQPESWDYRRSLRVILLSTTLYALLAFLVVWRRGGFSQVQYLTVILGVTAFLATNPFGLVSHKLDAFWYPLLMSVFVAFFRLYSFLIFDNIYHEDKSLVWLIIWIAFALILGYFEVHVNLKDTEWQDFGIVTSVDRNQMIWIGLALSWVVFILVFIIVTLVKAGSDQRFKVWAYFLFLLPVLLITVPECVFGRRKVIQRPMLFAYQATHVGCAIVFLFVQQSSLVDYERIDSSVPEKIEPWPGDAESDSTVAMSDDSDGDGDDEEDV
jgi:hypothetical protein